MKKYLQSMKRQSNPTKDCACRKSPWRFLFLGAAVLSGGWLMLYGLMLLLADLLPVTPEEAASIGIIGGADGPTAIFVTTAESHGFDWDILLVAAIFLIGILGFLGLRRCRKK